MPTNHLQNTLDRTITYAKSIKQLRPLTGIGGANNEPAFSIADDIRSLILSPPFAWSWNRSEATANVTVAGGQDYAVTIADFGWIEKAVLEDSSGKSKELTVKTVLAATTTQQRPESICAYEDDNAGAITFRLFPSPSDTYTLTVIYQKSPPLFAATTDNWTPIPDRYSYLYNAGFIAKVYERTRDGRYLPAFASFLRMLVSANGGLSEAQVNLFLEGQIDLGWANTPSLQRQGYTAQQQQPGR
jgi:hypothetical protein